MAASSLDIENMIVKISLGIPKDESGFPMDQKEYSDLWDSLSKEVQDMSQRGVIIESGFEFSEIPDMGPEERAKLLESKKKSNTALEGKSLGRRIGRRFRAATFNPKARDADADGMIQDGTRFERPATRTGTAPSTSMPNRRARRMRALSGAVSDDPLNLRRFSNSRVDNNRVSESQRVALVAPFNAEEVRKNVDMVESRVKDVFGEIETEKQAIAALEQVFLNADFSGFTFSRTAGSRQGESLITAAERAAVSALLDLGLQYPKTAEMLDSVGMDPEQKSSGRFGLRTGFTSAGSQVASSTSLSFGKGFENFISKYMSDSSQDGSNLAAGAVPETLASGIANISSLGDRETRARAAAMVLVAHEFGHAWHDRSTRTIGTDGLEHDPVDVLAQYMMADRGEVEKYFREALEASNDPALGPPPNFAGLSPENARKAMQDYQIKKAIAMSDVWLKAAERLMVDKSARFREYLRDGLSQQEEKQLVESTTISNYGRSNLNEAVAEIFAAQYLGLPMASSRHQERIWEFMNQTKIAQSESTANTLPDGSVIEYDENGIPSIVSYTCKGFDGPKEDES